MRRAIYRTILSLIIILLFVTVYLSTIGVKTNKFNPNILSQIKQIEPNIEIRLKDVGIKLDLFNLGINLKTIGTDLIYKNKIIKIETIKSRISIKSILNKKFFLTDISISTKSLAIKDLIAFMRLVDNDPKLFIAEKFIEKGYVIADVELKFDETGKIKKNYKFNGLVKDGKINFFKKYDLKKIDFVFEINEKNFKFKDLKISLNNNNILIPELNALKKNGEYLVSGKLNTNNINLKKNEIKNFINNDFLKLDIKEILFSSKNNFQFRINESFKINDLDIKSDIILDKLEFINPLKLKSFFPKIKKDIIFENQNLNLEYKKDILKIIGSGDIFLQNKIDQIEYEIYKKNDEVKFKSNLQISKNSFKIDFLNYEKNKNLDLKLNFEGSKKIKGKLIFKEISLREKEEIISITNLILSKDNKINDLSNIYIKYKDKYGLKNNLELRKKNNDYLVFGSSFNIKDLIDKLLTSENNQNLTLLNKNFKIFIDFKKVYLNKENIINNLKGFLLIKKNEISELNLESKFSDNQIIKLTIFEKDNEKITTLYSHKAKPFVDRYKFIKGFEDGDLDFYSIKKNGITSSVLKIDNFKIQEIPVLAKLLTLASLQGIADLLTGEGIRFTDFEMKFSNKDKLMTIEELYAIGPAISIMLEGYIQSKELISLRGTLVPATTVNRTISSIPLIGDILVGKKVGEGVFGVSFKIKGPPSNLETSVNPIKTLTPRFITRTLEKIKKN